MSQLDGNLGDSKRYVDLDWRLDIEISNKNLPADVESMLPKYMLRLDLCNSNVGALEQEKSSTVVTDSLHLEADYANMKNLQLELQNALDQLNTVHCKRFTKYLG